MSERSTEIHRKTGETDVFVSIDLDGTGKSEIDTGIGFFDHMLTLFSSHGQFDLRVKCDGDIEIDGHHSVEDIGITMGQAFLSALGDLMDSIWILTKYPKHGLMKIQYWY